MYTLPTFDHEWWIISRHSTTNNGLFHDIRPQIMNYFINKGNNKITELRTILQRESQNS